MLTSLAVIGVMGVSHLLSRTRYYHWGAFITLAGGTAIIFLEMFETYPDIDAFDFSYIVVVFLVGSALFSLRISPLFLIIPLLMVASIAVAQPALEFADFVGSITFTVVIAVFVILVMHNREELEAARQSLILDREQRLKLLLEYVPGIMWTSDSDLFITSLSGSLIGTYSDQLDRTARAYVCDVITSNVADNEQVATAHQQALRGEHASCTIQWESHVLDCRIESLRDIQGHIIGCVGVAIDITERLQHEQQALELNLAQQRSRIFTEFMHTSAHDLRTPLTSLKTTTYLAMQKNNDAQMQRQIERIDFDVKRMTDMIENVILMADLERTQTLEMTDTSINLLLTGLLHKYQLIATGKRITLLQHMADDPPIIKANQSQLADAISRILENAMTYTLDGGSVTISTHWNDDELEIHIQDTGIGIGEAHHAKIFEPFYRIESSRTLTAGHNGMGLAIVHKIIEKHDGRIRLISQPDEGSTFIIHLPIKRPTAAQQSLPITPN